MVGSKAAYGTHLTPAQKQVVLYHQLHHKLRRPSGSRLLCCPGCVCFHALAGRSTWLLMLQGAQEQLQAWLPISCLWRLAQAFDVLQPSEGHCRRQSPHHGAG